MANPQTLAIDTYLRELNDLVRQRAELGTRADRVESVVRGMIDLLDNEHEQMQYREKLEDVIPPTGLSAAIAHVLSSDDTRSFFPTEIRDRVKGFLLHHSNEMASVHTTLKRLSRDNLFVEVVDREGKTAYRWVNREKRLEQEITRHRVKTERALAQRKVSLED
jgi:hypothetical protein